MNRFGTPAARTLAILVAWTLLGAGLCSTIQNEPRSAYCYVTPAEYCVYDEPGVVGERCRCQQRRGRFG